MTGRIRFFAVFCALLWSALLLGSCGKSENPLPSHSEPSAPSASSSTTASTEEPETQLTPAPDFAMEDHNGNTLSLSDFTGKPVILNFWASWCSPCKAEMPHFQTAYEEYGDDIHFVLVNLTDGGQETVETAYGFIQDQGYTFPVYYDTAMAGAMTYGVNSIPVTYFIDVQGNIAAWGRGMLSETDLQYGIDLLLNPEG